MKTIITIYFLVFSFLITKNIHGQIKHQLEFPDEHSITEVILDDGISYMRIIAPELQSIDTIGLPKLPVKYIKLLLPQNSVVDGIKIDSNDMSLIHLNHMIEPGQAPIPINKNFAQQYFSPPSPKQYGSKQPFPHKQVEIVEDGFFRENHIVTLAIYPYRYYPQKNELIKYNTISFTLGYKTDKNKPDKYVKRKGYNKQLKILETLIDNKEDIDQFAVKPTDKKIQITTDNLNTLKSTGSSGISVDCDYVIITGQSLASSFDDFIEWKTRKGIDVELVTIDDIKSNYSGDNISGITDDAGKLRQFLADAYDNGNGIEYALLGGDNTVLPIRLGYDRDNTSNQAEIIPTDLYFSEFDGDWEVDGDGKYGEPNDDDVEFNPEIYIGRVMAKNSSEIANWTSKIIQYELNPGNGNYSYLTRAFYTQADQMQRDAWAETLSNSFSSVYSSSNTDIWNEVYNGVDDYNSSATPDSPTGNDIIDQMNTQKYGFVSWMGHGTPIGVAVGTIGLNSNITDSKWNVATLDNYDGLYGNTHIEETNNGIDDLTNSVYPAINYSISCDVIPFDDYLYSSTVRNVGESYTCISSGGGPAFLGNTRFGFIPFSKSLFLKFIYAITSQSLYNIGIAETYSKQNYYSRYLRFSHNLIGCPETELWTDTPTKFNSAYYTSSGSSVYVKTGGVSSTICVMSANDNGSSYHEKQTDVSSHTFNNVCSPFLVTITKHDYIPYLGEEPNDLYIQNELFYNQTCYYGKDVYAGQAVTTSKPQAAVVIKNGSNITLDAIDNVYLEAGFEVELGGVFETK